MMKDLDERAARSSDPTTGTPVDPTRFVESELGADPTAFEFFQAVRLLERAFPERMKVGGFPPAGPMEEVIRFSVNPSLAFPPGEVSEFVAAGDYPFRMEVNFLGLVGNQGVLPLHYSDLATGERVRDERPFTDFLDIFQHRILSLFYRAWERARFFVPFERGEEDPLSRHGLDLIGMGEEPLRRRMSVPDEHLVFYCGLMGIRQRGATALRQVLEDYFEVPVEVQQFVGGWYPLSEEMRSRIDEDTPEGGHGLGQGAPLGDELWDPQAGVRIRVGPVRRAIYDEFLPGGSAHHALRAVVSFFSDEQYDFELQLVLDREDVPGVRLGADADVAAAPLGWCTWIRTLPFDRDADETTFAL